MIRTIDTNLINIVQPEYVSKSRIHFEFKYKEQSGLIIQTPLSTIYDVDNIMSIGFPNIYFNKDVEDFIRLIESIDDYIQSIQKDLWKRIGKNMKDKKYHKSVFWNTYKTNVYMNLKLQKETIRNDNNEVTTTSYLDVYDCNKKKVKIDYIKPYSTGYHIIYLQNIWVSITNRTMGLQWYVIQSKIYRDVMSLNECIIEEDEYDKPYINPEIHCKCCMYKQTPKETSTKINLEDHPVYGKYMKMKKMGIPEGAIRLKMGQEGLKYEDMEKLGSGGEIKENVVNRPMINANMFSGVKLKKVEISAEEKKKEVIPLQLRDKYKPPSEEELKSILSRLKKRD
jgi:hypothetical protein